MNKFFFAREKQLILFLIYMEDIVIHAYKGLIRHGRHA